MKPHDDQPHAGSDDAASMAELLPCSLAQKRFWFLEQYSPANPSLNIATRWRMDGAVTDAAVEYAYRALIERHEILRTVFIERDGEPFQRVLDTVSSKISIVDLTRLQGAQRLEEAEKISAIDAQQSIDITRDIPVRMTMLRLDERCVMILLSMHHIASDGWSMGTLAHEFGTLVSSFMTGRDSVLEPLEMQFADFALWQADMLTSGAFDKDTAYWSSTLKALPYFEVPGDRPRPATLGSDCDFRIRVLDQPTGEQFDASVVRFGQTQFNIASAALALSLKALTGQNDVVIGTQVAGRDDVLLEPLVGLFINTVILRFDLAAVGNARELVEKCGATIGDALARRQYPFEQLVQVLNPPRDMSRTPLYSVNFTLIRPVIRSERFDGVDLVSLPSQPTGAQYDLLFFMVKRAEGWRLACESSRALYDAATVDRILVLWECALKALISGTDAKIDLGVLPGSHLTAAQAVPEAPQSSLSAAWPTTPQPASPIAVVPTQAALADLSGRIAQIWRDVLKVDEIDGATHFFEAGGHSLLALRMIARVNDLTGTRLPVATLFQSPTLAGFTASIANKTASAMAKQVTHIQAQGTKPPVIALNDGAVYHAIARLLPDRPFIDLHMAGEGGALQTTKRTFDQFAADAVRLIKAAQPEGPYTLMGHCVFGSLAYEAAQQLRRQGDEVSLVVMLDTIAPGYVEDMPLHHKLTRRLILLKYAGRHFFELVGKVRNKEMSLAGMLFQYGFLRRSGLMRVLGRLQPEDQREYAAEDFAQVVFSNHLLDARRAHRCRPYAGDVVQFRANTAREGRLFDRGFGWARHIAGRYDVITVPSDHFNMMKEPAATVVAAHIVDRLDQVQKTAAQKQTMA
ncbi:MAG: condensation domain-containing protein [Hyphomicrobiaceae bacterium]